VGVNLLTDASANAHGPGRQQILSEPGEQLLQVPHPGFEQNADVRTLGDAAPCLGPFGSTIAIDDTNGPRVRCQCRSSREPAHARSDDADPGNRHRTSVGIIWPSSTI
jgi:hypothetical protein